jgi:hypothetical protein
VPERQLLSRFPFSTPSSSGSPGEGGGCCLKRKPQLGVRKFGWSLKGVIEPVPEVTVGKQIQAEQGHQSAERHVVLRTELEIFEQQHGNQCCPNLSLQSIGAGADEGLDLQVLLEHFEEEFDLPAVPVYPANGGCSEGKVVSEKLNLTLVLFVPDNHPAQQFWILLSGHRAGESNELIMEHISMLRQGAVMYDFINGVLLESGNEENTGVVPLPEEFKVTVSAVHRDDAAGGKSKMAGSDDIGSLAFGDHREVRQIAVVVKEQVELNGTLRLTEISPRKQTETEVHGSRVEAEQFVLEAELLLFTRALTATEVPQMKEGILIELPGTVSVGVGKCALGRCGTQSQVAELAAGDGQSVADLPQALGLGELTEEHGDILVPGGKALGVALCPAFMDKARKGNPGYDLKYLAEQTCGKLHSRDSFEVFGGSLSPYYFEGSLFYHSA